MVPPLRRVTFFQTPKKVTKKRLPLRTAFAALRFPRSGVHQGASTPVGFASTSIRCPRLRRGALRACPLMNASTRPPDGAGRSRSKAAPCATYRSALNPVAAAEPARLRSTAQQAQDLETAGGPSVLSQPAAAATGLGRHQGRVGQIWFCKAMATHYGVAADASVADLSRSKLFTDAQAPSYRQCGPSAVAGWLRCAGCVAVAARRLSARLFMGRRCEGLRP
ncbi:hypothetical protein C4K25_5680 [Pseudomonas chlororaphis]|nr:hypothetical protein C4K25_5680 [Pseudomonas chlororaphis]